MQVPLWGRDHIEAIISAWNIPPLRHLHTDGLKLLDASALGMDTHLLSMGTAPVAILGFPQVASQTVAMTKGTGKEEKKTHRIFKNDFNQQTGLGAHVKMRPPWWTFRSTWGTL